MAKWVPWVPQVRTAQLVRLVLLELLVHLVCRDLLVRWGRVVLVARAAPVVRWVRLVPQALVGVGVILGGEDPLVQPVQPALVETQAPKEVEDRVETGGVLVPLESPVPVAVLDRLAQRVVLVHLVALVTLVRKVLAVRKVPVDTLAPAAKMVRMVLAALVDRQELRVRPAVAARRVIVALLAQLDRVASLALLANAGYLVHRVRLVRVDLQVPWVTLHPISMALRLT